MRKNSQKCACGRCDAGAFTLFALTMICLRRSERLLTGGAAPHWRRSPAGYRIALPNCSSPWRRYNGKTALTLVEALEGIVEPAGKTVIDVGCGDGTLVRHFARLGARAIGIEVSAGQLERALKQAGEGESYNVASGERLPFADARPTSSSI